MTADVTAEAPGKLVLAGEFAVLEPGQPGIVAAVSRRVTAQIQWGEAGLTAQGRSCTWRLDGRAAVACLSDQPFGLIARAMSVAFAFLEAQGVHPEGFSLRLSSTMHDETGVKLGLGSSAATAVAVLAAVLSAFGKTSDRLTLFKLAVIAHRLALGPGSGMDVAASVYGGHLLYRGVAQRWLQGLLSRGGAAAVGDIATRTWPDLMLEPLPQPALTMRVGWTGEAASTADQLRRLGRQRRFHPEAYRCFLAQSDAGVMKLAHALRNADPKTLLEAVQGLRQALWRLSSELAMPVETARLTRLADLAEWFGGAGKSSGAGGGDCGIAFVPENTSWALERSWREQGLTPLDIEAGADGVFVAQDSALPASGVSPEPASGLA